MIKGQLYHIWRPHSMQISNPMDNQDCHHCEVDHEPLTSSSNLNADNSKYRNYTGDVLNFGLAKEHYASLHPQKADKIKFVVVGDDVAVGREQGKIVGRRYRSFSSIPLDFSRIYHLSGALQELYWYIKLLVPWPNEEEVLKTSIPLQLG